MIHMIDEYDGEVFHAFVRTPFCVDSSDFYSCAEKRVLVEGLDESFGKRMFWCRPRHYETESGSYGVVKGFYCAGALYSETSAFVFIPSKADDEAVTPKGVIIDVDMFGD